MNQVTFHAGNEIAGMYQDSIPARIRNLFVLPSLLLFVNQPLAPQ
jgi:hypothetical protein